MKNNLIKERSFKFALSIIKLFKKLQVNNEFIISKQLLRSGTSIGANIEEASAAQSKKDFLHKMTIASKEARETSYWLRLLKESDLIDISFDEYLDEINQIIKIVTKIVKTTSKNLKQQ